MKFGIVLPVEGNVLRDGKSDYRIVAATAVRADELGFDSIWAGERLLSSQRFEPLLTLASISGNTKHARLGTSVLIASLRHPVLLANQLSTLDHISNGRVILGLGVGAERIKSEYDSVRIPFRERGKRLDESIAIMKRIWNGEEVTFEGKYYKLNNVRMRLRPLRNGGPPIWLGGATPKLLQRAGQFAQGWMPMELSPESYHNSFTRLSAFASSSGRDPSKIERALYTTINTDRDTAEAKKQAQKYLETYYSAKFESIDKFGIFGTVNDCIKAFEDYSSAGVDTIVVRFGSFKDPIQEVDSFEKNILTSF
jgi:probable F420-dependent oxidoreductase